MIRILHLSDIHLGNADSAEIYRSQLEIDLTHELKVDRLDFLVVSGDIADQSTPDEYAAAEKLFTGVTRRFKIAPENVIMVPGNHDLNRTISKKEGYELIDREDYKGKPAEGEYIPVDDEVIRVRVPEKYKERFRHFCDFHQQVTGKPYPLEYPKQGVVQAFNRNEMLFLGLNSAWEIDHHYTARSGIHPNAIAHALDQISEVDCGGWLKMAVCHHPVTGPDMMKNVDFLERLSGCGFQVLLHGHVHKAQQGFYHYDDKRQIHIVGAGTFGAPVKDMVAGIPLQYNLLEYEPEINKIIVRTRKKESPEGAWTADARWGDKEKPVPYHEIDLKSKDKPSGDAPGTCVPKPEVKKKATLEIPYAYRDWVFDFCGHMDVDHLQEKGSPITVSLPEVFIDLYTTAPGKLKEDEVPDPETLLKISEHNRAVEDVIAESQDLIIKGEAGSGKTTLVKHFVYMCLKQPGWKGMTGILPVLIFLKDLKGFDWQNAPQNEETAEALLHHVFRQSGCGLDVETVRQYCAAGKALFLLDGLDEIEIGLRDLAANVLTRYRRVCQGGRFVFSGRPHGVAGDVVNRFDNHAITILPLTLDQVNTFITKWFQSVEHSRSDRVTRTAQGMISEIRDNPGVEKLIYNPLMLTAVCILYYDKKALPGQRSELFEKFVENMLHRGQRIKDPELVHAFLMCLAYFNHTRKKKGCDIQSALALLKDIYPNQGLTDVEYGLFIQQTFSRIEPDCGLLKFDSGQLTFRHLTFQEFLTAEYIKDRKTKYNEAIKSYWEDEWYKEVVELLVGLLSIGSRQWANDIVEGALRQPDKPPFYRWRLGARSILDIHADRQDTHVVDLAGEKMRAVMVSKASPKDRADAGEILGWLGDRRDMEVFKKIPDGAYETSTGKVRLKGFEMAKYPVTNQWYKKFMDDHGYETDAYWSKQGLIWLNHTRAKYPQFYHDRKWNCPNHPVVGVCWWEADAFCRWLTQNQDDGFTFTYRLHTEQEWEATAAGFEKRKYPWGNEFDANRCNVEETKIEQTSAVGIFINGETPEGVRELSGNVWEWTKTNYHSKKGLADFKFDEKAQQLYEKIMSISGEERNKLIDEYFALRDDKKSQFPALRGGSWVGTGGLARCGLRGGGLPTDRDYVIGFRCSRTK